MPRSHDLALTLAGVVVAAAAVAGGAFGGGERVVVTVLLAAILGLATAWQRYPVAPEESMLLLLLAWSAAVAVLHPVYPLSAKEAIAVWLVAWLLWRGARRLGERAASAVGLSLAAAAFWLGLAAVAEALEIGMPRAGGILENPNVTAALLVAVAPWLWQAAGPRPLAKTAATVFLAAGIAATGSRAGMIALAAAVMAALPAGRWRRLGLVLASGVAVVGILWRLAATSDPLAWHRLAIWRSLLTLVADHPVTGVGPWALADSAGGARILDAGALGQFERVLSQAESTPVGILVQTGAVGLILALAAAAVWMRSATRRGLWDTPPARATVAAMATFALFHDISTVDPLLWWWAALLGLAEGRGRVRAPDPDPARQVGRWASGLGVCGLLLWALSQPAWAREAWRAGPRDLQAVERALRAEPWLAEAPAWRSAALLVAPRWGWHEAAEALAWSDHSTRLHPGSARAWGLSGRVQARVTLELGAWPNGQQAAREAFRRATSLEPRLPWWWIDWAALERGLGRPEMARSLTERALASEPDCVRARLLLARLELDLGRPDRAREALAAARRSRARGAGRLLTRYQRELLQAPDWQLESIEKALR